MRNGPEQTVEITVQLPKEIYGRVAQAAAYEQRRLDEIISTLVVEGLDAHASLYEILQRVSEQYRARLMHTQKLNQSPDQVLQNLRDLREQVASELYPA